MNRTAEEITEIERHKYFLSEKQGYDVGWEFAERDWERNFAAEWRESQSPAVCLTRTDSAGNPGSAAEVPRFRIGSLLSRFFSKEAN